MTDVTPARTRRPGAGWLPLRLFTAVLAISVLAAVVSVWQAWTLDNRLDDLRSRQFRVTEYMSQVMLFDEVLTMSARMAAATGDLAYKQRYEKFDAQLDALIKASAGAFQGPDAQQFIRQTDEANRQLVEIERRALALVSEGRRTEAAALLVGKEYAKWKGVYAAGVQSFMAAERVAIEHEQRNFHVLTHGFEVSSGVIILVLVSTWYFALLAAHRWRRERVASDAALREAHQELEHRVLERTAELRVANETLAGRSAALAQEVAERSRLQAALATASAIVESSPFVLLRWQFPATSTGPEGAVPEYISDNFDRFGYQPTEFMSGAVDFFRDIVHPEDRESVIAAFTAAVGNGGPGGSVDFRIIRKSGETCWVEGHMRSDLDAASGLVQWQCILRDITAAKEVETQLGEEHRFVSALLESVPGFFVLIDSGGRIVRWNEQLPALTGLSDAQLQGVDALSLVVETDRDVVRERMHDLFVQGRSDADFGMPGADGETHAVHFAGQRVTRGERPYLLAIGMDVTETHKAQARLRADEERFRAIFNHVSDAIIVHDAGTGAFLDVNEPVCAMYGYARDELLEAGLPAVCSGPPPYTLERSRGFFERAAKGEPVVFEWLSRRKDGQEFWLEVSARRARFGDRDVVLSTGRDISERKRSESDQALLAAIVNSSRDAIIGKTLSGTITSWNAAAKRMYGYRAEEVVGQNIRMIVPEGNHEELDASLTTLARGEAVEQPDTERLTKDGRRIPTALTISPIRDAAGTVVGASTIARDISEQKRDAAELAYRDRLLHAIAVGTAALVQGESLEHGMSEALRIVGESMQVDRVIVVQDCPDQVPPAVMRYVWQAPDIEVCLDSSGFAVLPMDPLVINKWRAPLHDRRPVITHIRTIEGPLRRVLEYLHNKSTLLMPIFVGDKLWGNFGIDSCAVERQWTANEIEALETFGDITGSLIQRNGTRLSLERSEERFRVLSATAQDAIIMIDAEGMTRYWNESAHRILGYSAEEVTGKNLHKILVPERFRDQVMRGMAEFARTGQGPVLGTTLELAAIRKDGVEIPIELSINAMRLGSDLLAVGILRDITDRKTTEDQIRQMARHDALTGLANRSVFVETLQHEIARVHAGAQSFAVLYIDLDHFKDVNDTLGHPIGDLLLQAVAGRLERSVRATDTVARFGGDEFGVIVTSLSEPSDVAAIASKLLESMSDPFLIEGNEVRSGASVGIAVYTVDLPDVETLLAHADVALYRAKSEGRGTFRFFTDSMDDEVRMRVTVRSELREAITSGQLLLLYQPQVEIQTGRVVGMEALVRWRHPTRGILKPADFIPAAERSGLIIMLGRWILREACSQARRWLDAGLTPLIAVNLSGSQFRTPYELEGDIGAILAETGVPPQLLELELTEGVLMEASQQYSDTLLRLRASGVRIAIDDFGTGYSSLDYLRRFPVDRIKIAQNFIAELGAAPGSGTIVKAALGLARELDIDVIAEGVETTAQLELLKAWGCKKVQGYYFAKPLPAGEMTALLRAGTIKPAAAVEEEASVRD